MPDSANIPETLSEVDGVFQNLTVAVGVSVKLVANGMTRLEVTDRDSKAGILLTDAERRHLVTLLDASASE